MFDFCSPQALARPSKNGDGLSGNQPNDNSDSRLAVVLRLLYFSLDLLPAALGP